MCAPTARNTASKPPVLHASSRTSSTLALSFELHAQVEDALHLAVEHVARQAVGGDAEAHHAAGHGPGLVDRDLVAQARQVVGRREPRGPRADDQHLLAGGRGGRVELPAALERLVAEEVLDRVDADGGVELRPVARALARVVADAPHHRGHGVVLHERAPGRLVVAALGVEEPALDVLARGAGVVAGRQAVEVLGAQRAPGAGVVGEAGARVQRDGEGFSHAPSSSRPYLRMLRSAASWMRRITSSRGLGEKRCA